MPIVDRADRQNSGITAHAPSAITAETSGHKALPAPPCHVGRSGRLAVIVARDFRNELPRRKQRGIKSELAQYTRRKRRGIGPANLLMEYAFPMNPA